MDQELDMDQVQEAILSYIQDHLLSTFFLKKGSTVNVIIFIAGYGSGLKPAKYGITCIYVFFIEGWE